MTRRRWVAQERRTLLWTLLGALLVVLSAVLTALGAPLVTSEVPSGILSYEFAGSNEVAARMVGSWGPQAREAAYLTLGIDFLYLFVYPAWFSLGSWMLADALEGRLARAGALIATAVWFAAPLDAVENWALLQLLAADPADGLARLAMLCAVPKFALVGLAASYLVVGAVALFRRGRRSGR